MTVNTKPKPTKRLLFNASRRRNFTVVAVITATVLLRTTTAVTAEQFTPTQIDQKQLDCLSENLFFEGRNTNYDEMVKISNVVLNRMANHNYPSDACSVINQHYQFSWTLDKRNNMKRIMKLIKKDETEHKAWLLSKFVAALALTNQLNDSTGHAVSYHHVRIKKPKSSFWKHMKLSLISKYHKYYALDT